MASDPIRYMERTRTYYAALGYDPYQWARFDDVPFAPLRRALRDCTVALVTTAAPFDPGKGEQGPGAPYNAAAKFYRVYSGSSAEEPDLRISHIAIDRTHTTAEDINTYFPLAALRRAAARGQVGGLAPRFHGLPTNRSQRTTLEVDCAELVRRVIADGADAVILVPNCPVCHQSCALAARALEGAGIASVIMGAALDIVEHAGVPRFLFSDVPLGNSAGRPNDRDTQDRIMTEALDMLSDAPAPRTTWRSGVRWSDDEAWKQDYCNIDRLSADRVECLRADYAAVRDEARRVRQASTEETDKRR